MAASSVCGWGCGLRAAFFQGTVRWNQEPDFVVTVDEVSTATMKAWTPWPIDQPFRLQYSGFLYVSRSGRYLFHTASDDGSWVIVDGALVVDNGGTHPRRQSSGVVDLTRGVHSLIVRYQQDGGDAAMTLSWAPSGDVPRPIPRWRLAPRNAAPWRFALAGTARTAATVAFLLWMTLVLTWIVVRAMDWHGWMLLATGGLLALGVTFDVPHWLRGPAPYPFEWQWPYVPRATFHGLDVVASCAVAIVTLLIVVTDRPARFQKLTPGVIVLVAGTLLAFGWQLGTIRLLSTGALKGIVSRTLSDDVTSYFTVAANPALPTQRLLAEYDRLLPALPGHAATHPPGPILFYRATLALVQRFPALSSVSQSVTDAVRVPRPQTVTADQTTTPQQRATAALLAGLIVSFMGPLACWPLLIAAWRTGLGGVHALQIALLYLLVPAPLLFAPQFDNVSTFLTAAVVAGLATAATASNARHLLFGAAACGAGAALALLASFGSLALVPAAGLIALTTVSSNRRVDPRRLVIGGFVASLVFLLVSGLAHVFGYSFFRSAAVGLAVHREDFTLRRSLGLWWMFNLLDFALFLGVPLVVYAFLLALETVRKLPLAATAPQMRGLWCGLAIVLLLDLSGTTRGEVGRIWMPLMPALLLAVAAARQRDTASSPHARDTTFVAMALALAATTVAIGTFWSVSE